MAHLNANSQFQSWVLTDQERIQGTILTITQKQCIQNQITVIAHERLNLTIDLDNPAKSAARDAELAGQIAALSYLLDLSAAAEDELREPHINPSGE